MSVGDLRAEQARTAPALEPDGRSSDPTVAFDLPRAVGASTVPPHGAVLRTGQAAERGAPGTVARGEPMHVTMPSSHTRVCRCTGTAQLASRFYSVPSVHSLVDVFRGRHRPTSEAPWVWFQATAMKRTPQESKAREALVPSTCAEVTFTPCSNPSVRRAEVVRLKSNGRAFDKKVLYR